MIIAILLNAAPEISKEHAKRLNHCNSSTQDKFHRGMNGVMKKIDERHNDMRETI